MRAVHSSIVHCRTYDLLSRVPKLSPRDAAHCRRCGARLSFRNSDGTAKTWALLLSAMILYVPANLLPVMKIVSFGRVEADTIFSGVVSLATSGNWSIALIVFVASIAIPALKILALMILLLSVQLHWRWLPAERTRLFWIVEGIGRWSMIDVFVTSMLVALITLEQVATVEPGAGMVCFAGVVILTLLAAMSFDPREIWDSMETSHG